MYGLAAGINHRQLPSKVLRASLAILAGLRFGKTDALMDSIPTVSALAQAEGWLSLVAEHIAGVSDQEALVYLRRRGREYSDQVSTLVNTWKVAEQARVEEHSDRVGKTGRAEANIADILDVPTILLPGFWEGASPEDYSFETTMLRTVDWCKIVGFDQWWRLLAPGAQRKAAPGRH